MAKAIRIEQVERERLDWFKVFADDGRQYKYLRRGPIQTIRPPQVRSEFIPESGAMLAKIARDEVGEPFLQQDEPGLPPKIMAEYICDLDNNGAVVSFWQSTMEFELASS